MRNKYSDIKNLAQLQDDEFFEKISLGLNLIVENALRFIDDSIFLAKNERSRGCEVLRNIAEEEAGKFFVLMDTVRCDRSRNEDRSIFSRQLGYFNDHLPKAIYAEYYDLRHARFVEVIQYVDNVREEYYLDGPNDVDWIFRNRMLRQRDENLYVDYIESEQGSYWRSPQQSAFAERGNLIFCQHLPFVLDVMKALSEAGCITAQALELIASKWRPIKMTEDFSIDQLRILNSETLEELERKGLLCQKPQNIYATIINDWRFPLYSLDLSQMEVKKSGLLEIRDQWTPDL
jgi:AbiV family abortive infection protein